MLKYAINYALLVILAVRSWVFYLAVTSNMVAIFIIMATSIQQANLKRLYLVNIITENIIQHLLVKSFRSLSNTTRGTCTMIWSQ